MDRLKKEMLKIYKPLSHLDWMNYTLVKRDVTYHHIIKQESGGERTIENGALLMPIAHQYLHLIECKDNDTYVAINKIFKYVNEQRHEPTREQRDIVEYLLGEFERVHARDKSSKGKILVRRDYMIRSWDK